MNLSNISSASETTAGRGAKPAFHRLTVEQVRRETPDSISVRFEVPEHLCDAYAFTPGQYLTLRATIDGQDLRRSYSICCVPDDGYLRVGIRRVDGGRFSTWANESLAAGDEIDVMTPDGRFTVDIDPNGAREVLAIAAGSGITPVLSIVRAVLEGERGSEVTLVYGNRETASIMFREEIEDLKDRFVERFRLIHMLSRQAQDVDLFNGRVDRGSLMALAGVELIDPANADDIFLCGPGQMIEDAQDFCQSMGAAAQAIHIERFTPAEDAQPAQPSQSTVEAAKAGVSVSVVLDGLRKQFVLDDPKLTVLKAAEQAGLDLPFSCAGGMCATCRCRLVEGKVEMAVNYALQPWELEAGFVLACQSRPTTDRLVLDFDAA